MCIQVKLIYGFNVKLLYLFQLCLAVVSPMDSCHSHYLWLHAASEVCLCFLLCSSHLCWIILFMFNYLCACFVLCFIYTVLRCWVFWASSFNKSTSMRNNLTHYSTKGSDSKTRLQESKSSHLEINSPAAAYQKVDLACRRRYDSTTKIHCSLAAHHGRRLCSRHPKIHGSQTWLQKSRRFL